MRLVTIGLKGLAALAFAGVALGASVATAAPRDGYHAGPAAKHVVHHHRHRHHHHRNMVRR